MDMNERAVGTIQCCLGFCGFFFCRFCFLAGLAKVGLFALRAACIALCSGYDIDNNTSVVFPAFGARAVRFAERSALALRGSYIRERMMRTPLSGLGFIATHPDYHSGKIIQKFRPLATAGKKWRDEVLRGPIA